MISFIYEERSKLMLTRKIILAIAAVMLAAMNTGWGARSYTYTVTVGKDPNTYDYTTINAAIDAMNAKNPPLDEETLGKIEIYDGTYEEQLNDYYEDGNNVPAHCDLIGMGNDIDDVVIEHKSISSGSTDTPHPGVMCNGDNVISNLKIYNDYSTGIGVNTLRFLGDGELIDCIVDSSHVAVDGHENLTVDNCTIYSRFTACISAYEAFEISDSNLYPRGGYSFIEMPTGIVAKGSGTIDNVTISGDITYRGTFYMYPMANVFGIYLLLDDEESVKVSDTDITLRLISDCNETPPLLHGFRTSGGHVEIKDCTIDVNGVETTGDDPNDPNDDGSGISVDGILLGGMGAERTIYVYGNTSVTTNRTAASNVEEGHEYLLNNTKGTLAVDFNTVTFDPNGDGDPNCYDPNYVNGHIEEILGSYYVKDNSGTAVAWFDNYGNLFLTGTLTSGGTCTAPSDSFIIADANDDTVAYIDDEGDMCIEGSSSTSCQSCTPPDGSFIIRSFYGEDVGYIDSDGNLCLTGGLYDEYEE
jgi:hypothetical protein